MGISEILDEAISEKKIITFLYDGYSRIVEPHHYGILNGSQQLHGYQIGGASRSGSLPQWRNFKLAKMSNLAKNDNIFSLESSYNPSNSHYNPIEKKVA